MSNARRLGLLSVFMGDWKVGSRSSIGSLFVALNHVLVNHLLMSEPSATRPRNHTHKASRQCRKIEERRMRLASFHHEHAAQVVSYPPCTMSGTRNSSFEIALPIALCFTVVLMLMLTDFSLSLPATFSSVQKRYLAIFRSAVSTRMQAAKRFEPSRSSSRLLWAQ